MEVQQFSQRLIFFTQPVSVGIANPIAILQEYIRQTYFSYEIVSADDGYCWTTILKAIKIEIQRRLNISNGIVLKAVVIVPAHFNDSQKCRTKNCINGCI
ncbi:hypothetical protein EHI2019_000939800 [Entamoeba histolytica]